MDNRKKRKSEAIVDSDDGTNLLPPPSPRRRITSKRPALPDQNTWMLQQKKALLVKGLKEINTAQQEFLRSNPVFSDPSKKSSPSTAMLHFAAEWKRQVNDLKAHYGRIPGIMVTMGMDDANQMGSKEISEAENRRSNYPPTANAFLRNRIVQVAAGGLHTVALQEDGQVYTFGASDEGTLGREPAGTSFEDHEQYTPTKVTGFGLSKHAQSREVDENEVSNEDDTIISVAAGDSHCLYLTIRGNVYMNGMVRSTTCSLDHRIARSLV